MATEYDLELEVSEEVTVIHGYDKGYSDGREVGYSQGYEAGYSEASEANNPAATIKALVDSRGNASYIFENSKFTEDDYAKYIRYDTFENAKYFTFSFRWCKAKRLPLFDTKIATNWDGIFDSSNIEYISMYDCRSIPSFYMPFNGCSKLKEIWIKNIKANLQVASGNSWGHLLTVESLIHLIKELRYTGSLKRLTMGSVNCAKLANTYVRLVEVTDEMRAADDLIDEKLPFELCESTDEGACLITDYTVFKNWEIY